MFSLNVGFFSSSTFLSIVQSSHFARCSIYFRLRFPCNHHRSKGLILPVLILFKSNAIDEEFLLFRITIKLSRLRRPSSSILTNHRIVRWIQPKLMVQLILTITAIRKLIFNQPTQCAHRGKCLLHGLFLDSKFFLFSKLQPRP